MYSTSIAKEYLILGYKVITESIAFFKVSGILKKIRLLINLTSGISEFKQSFAYKSELACLIFIETLFYMRTINNERKHDYVLG